MMDLDKISIHALREEGDGITGCKLACRVISIHALREEGDCPLPDRLPVLLPISIHALREEGDPPASEPGHGRGEFLSTPSARRATRCTGSRAPDFPISIHALREEGDLAIRSSYPRR